MNFSLKLTTAQLATLRDTLAEFRQNGGYEISHTILDKLLLYEVKKFEAKLKNRMNNLEVKPLLRQAGKSPPTTRFDLEPGPVIGLWIVFRLMPYDTDRQHIFTQLDQMKVNL